MPALTSPWNAAGALREAHERYVRESHPRLIAALQRQDKGRAQALPRDPSYEAWDRFRPLRLSREEDWADWLAHLVETCDGGNLCLELFGVDVGRVMEVKREVPVRWVTNDPEDSGEYRADMLVVGEQGTLHVEVKVGDPHLLKTWPTSQALRLGVRDRDGEQGPMSDVLLVLPRQATRALFAEVATQNAKHESSVHVVDWARVALALRRRLHAAAHLSTWTQLTHVFVGAVEQTLLGHAHFHGDRLMNATALHKTIAYLEKALKHD